MAERIIRGEEKNILASVTSGTNFNKTIVYNENQKPVFVVEKKKLSDGRVLTNSIDVKTGYISSSVD